MDVFAPLDERPQGRRPLEAAFAAYLSSRVDLLSQTEALTLAATSSPTIVTSPDVVARRFTEETGSSLEKAFGDFETEPFDSGPLFQWHRARLTNGEPVIFKTLHRNVGERLEPDLEGSSLLKADLQPLLERRSPSDVSRAVNDFRSFLESSLDLRGEGDDLIDLRDRCEGMSLVAVPRVHLDVSGASFLTLSDIGGSTIAERGVASATAPENGGPGPGPRLARRLCRAWLRLALSAGTVATSLHGRNVLLLADGKVAFCGGPFQPLSSHAQDHLRAYLAATAIQDHRSQADALLDLSHPRSRQDERRLRHQLRHTAPFRDGGWDSDSDSLSRALLAHWHQATTLGFRPRPALSAFLRGLTLLTREARTLAPGESSFREAFQELRLHQLFAESTRLLTGDEAAALVDLPRKLDRGLTLAPGDGSQPYREETAGSSPGTWGLVLALLMALVAVVLLVHHAAPTASGDHWIEKLGAGAVLILGGFLLRLAADDS
jgi:ubiquinone biosynthesis protein